MHSIRPATRADLPQIRAINTHYIKNTSLTFAQTPPPAETHTSKLLSLQSLGLPYLVAVDCTKSTREDTDAQNKAKEEAEVDADADADADIVLGYAFLSPFRGHLVSYASTVELSLFVHPNYQSRSIGFELLKTLLESVSRGEVRHCVTEEGQVSDGEETGVLVNSIIAVMAVDPEGKDGGDALRRWYVRCGFVERGRMVKVGFKRGHCILLRSRDGQGVGHLPANIRSRPEFDGATSSTDVAVPTRLFPFLSAGILLFCTVQISHCIIPLISEIQSKLPLGISICLAPAEPSCAVHTPDLYRIKSSFCRSSISKVTSLPALPTSPNSTQQPHRGPHGLPHGQKTWFESRYQDYPVGLAHIIAFFQEPRTRESVYTFLRDVPASSGWIHPLLPVFEECRNRLVHLFVMPCPRIYTRASDDKVAEHPDLEFTSAFTSAVTRFVEEATKLPVVTMYFRKECRLNNEGKDCELLREDRLLLSRASLIELLIAKNVYGIRFQTTLGWAQELSVSDGGLHSILQLEPDILSDAMTALFAPIYFRLKDEDCDHNQNIRKRAFRGFVRRLLGPALSRMTRTPEREVEKYIFVQFRYGEDATIRRLGLVVS